MGLFDKWNIQFSSSTRAQYHTSSLISDEESTTDILEKDELLNHEPRTTHSSPQAYRNTHSRRSIVYSLCWRVAFIAVNLILLIWSLISLHQSEKIKRDFENNVDNIVLKKTSYYSPILSSLPFKLHDTTFSGSLFAPHNISETPIYRQPPSPEVDAAWERISNVGTIVISSSDITKLGKEPKTTVRYPKSWGYGEDAYVGFIDGFHQIHCLDILRKAAYTNRPYYESKPHHHHGHSHSSHTRRSNDGNITAFERAHVDHCVYTLLQNLMCNANTDVITYNWVKGQDSPFPDFNTNHKCRNFDALVEWQYANRVDYEKSKTLVRPTSGKEAEGIVELPAPDEGV